MVAVVVLWAVGLIVYAVLGGLVAKWISTREHMDREVFIISVLIWPVLLPIQLLLEIAIWMYDKFID